MDFFALRNQLLYHPPLILGQTRNGSCLIFNLFTDPLSTENFENNHKTVEEVCEVPSRHLTFREHTLLRTVVVPVQLHSHHGEDEDDDADDEGEI